MKKFQRKAHHQPDDQHHKHKKKVKNIKKSLSIIIP